MTRPSIYHSQGYTCAEALIKSYNEEHNTDIPISIGSGMGVGMNVGSVCGAVNAAVVIIGNTCFFMIFLISISLL